MRGNLAPSFLFAKRHSGWFARGFTLIELLVVIAIIAILASIILASLNQARTKSRDARRVADMKQVQLALELYNNDNGYYPPQATFGNLSGISSALVPNYISALPTDPGSNTYYYATAASGATSANACSSSCPSYVLRTQLENNNTSILNGSAASITGTGYTTTPTCGVSGSNYYYCVRP